MTITLDIQKIVKKYSITKIPPEDKEEVDLKNPIILWTNMVVTHAPAVFNHSTSKSTIKTHSLFRSVFTNDTLHPQTYSVKNVRTTVNIFDCYFEKSYRYGAESDLMLHDVVINRQQVQEIGKKGADEKPHELEWVIKMDVNVPPHLATTLEVMVKEKEFEEDFEIVSTFDGTVKVIYLDDTNYEEKTVLEISVKDMFTHIQNFIMDEQGRPTYVTKGKLKNKTATEQLVQLTEGPLPHKTK